MAIQKKKYPVALKHAGFSATTILPGESAKDFDELHRSLIDEFNPNGALEDDIVGTVAHLVWRKKNLITFRVAELAMRRKAQIWEEKVPCGGKDSDLPTFGAFNPAHYPDQIRTANEQARNELGEAYELIEIGATATVEQLVKDLDIQDRLDEMVDRCIKRLLRLRGLKSVSNPSYSTPPKLIASSRAA